MARSFDAAFTAIGELTHGEQAIVLQACNNAWLKDEDDRVKAERKAKREERKAEREAFWEDHKALKTGLMVTGGVVAGAAVVGGAVYIVKKVTESGDNTGCGCAAEASEKVSF